MISRRADERNRALKLTLDALAIAVQLSACILWPVIEAGRGNMTAAWAIPSALVLTSFGWWENFINEKRPVEKRTKGDEFTIFEKNPEDDANSSGSSRVGES